MVTWDWPLPMEPDLNVGLLRDPKQIASAGVILFLPWYLLRGRKLNLAMLVNHARMDCQQEHLRDWVQKRGGQGAELGDTRFAWLGWIYRFHELVLRQRYPSACDGNINAIDRALARVLNRDEDTVKKMRLQLRHALGEA